MILLPLMTAWMWFQILTASPLPALALKSHYALGSREGR